MESNPLTRLKRVARRHTLTLTHYGRKTRKPHEVTIWFVVDGDKVYLGTANVNRQGVRNVQKTPQIRLSIGGETFEGTARFRTDRAEHERAMAAIRRKYWMYRPQEGARRFSMPSSKDDLKQRLTRYRQIRIGVIGRKSGRTTSIPVWFALEGPDHTSRLRCPDRLPCDAGRPALTNPRGLRPAEQIRGPESNRPWRFGRVD
jgi:deazaflavin-dependent oxidoreductase (nitroreductase family)